MIKSRLCDLIGIKYPIIQAGMGPFSNNNLCVATANAGVLGLLSTSGVFNKNDQPWVYNDFVRTGEADPDDDMATVVEKVLKRTYRLVKDKGGVFGPNVMVSKEVLNASHIIIDTAIKVREENPEMKKCFKVMYTSAGDPMGWEEKIKGAGFTWIHIVPSVRAALRCKKAGVDVVVASGHEGGFHTSWEPVHTMVLLPAAIDQVRVEAPNRRVEIRAFVGQAELLEDGPDEFVEGHFRVEQVENLHLIRIQTVQDGPQQGGLAGPHFPGYGDEAFALVDAVEHGRKGFAVTGAQVEEGRVRGKPEGCVSESVVL